MCFLMKYPQKKCKPAAKPATKKTISINLHSTLTTSYSDIKALSSNSMKKPKKTAFCLLGAIGPNTLSNAHNFSIVPATTL